MSIAKIKAMTETLAKMEKMQKETQDEINKDIDKKREAAFKEICKYLDEVAEALDGRSMSIDFPQHTFFGYSSGQAIKFNSKYRTNKSGISTYYSEDKKNWYIDCYNGYKNENGFYEFIDAETPTENPRKPGTWTEGIIPLIEKWSEIKMQIEQAIETELTKRMTKVREDTQKKVTSYKIVDDFEA